MAIQIPSDWQEHDLAFHFDAGRLCLNFTASVGDRAHAVFDRWRNVEDYCRWFTQAGLPTNGTQASDRMLGQGQALREAIYRAISAARDSTAPAAKDITLINAQAAGPSLAPQLGNTGRTRTWLAANPFEEGLSMIARDAIDLLTGADLERLRECAEATCSVLFIDASRPGKRRWCSMTRCGNRAKKKAFRERQRQT